MKTVASGVNVWQSVLATYRVVSYKLSKPYFPLVIFNIKFYCDTAVDSRRGGCF